MFALLLWPCASEEVKICFGAASDCPSGMTAVGSPDTIDMSLYLSADVVTFYCPIAQTDVFRFPQFLSQPLVSFQGSGKSIRISGDSFLSARQISFSSIPVDLTPSSGGAFRFNSTTLQNSPLSLNATGDFIIAADSIDADFVSLAAVRSLQVSRLLILNSTASSQIAPLAIADTAALSILIRVNESPSIVQLFDGEITVLAGTNRFAIDVSGGQNVTIEPANDQADISFRCMGARGVPQVWIKPVGRITFQASMWPFDQGQFLLYEAGRSSASSIVLQDDAVPLRILGAATLVCDATICGVTGDVGADISVSGTSPTSVLRIRSLNASSVTASDVVVEISWLRSAQLNFAGNGTLRLASAPDVISSVSVSNLDLPSDASLRLVVDPVQKTVTHFDVQHLEKNGSVELRITDPSGTDFDESAWYGTSLRLFCAANLVCSDYNLTFDPEVFDRDPFLSLSAGLFEKVCSSDCVSMTMLHHSNDRHNLFCLADDASRSRCSPRTFQITSVSGWQTFPSPSTSVLLFDLAIPPAGFFDFSSFDSNQLHVFIRGQSAEPVAVDLNDSNFGVRALTLSNVLVRGEFGQGTFVSPASLELSGVVEWNAGSELPISGRIVTTLSNFLKLPPATHHPLYIISEIPAQTIEFTRDEVKFSAAGPPRTYYQNDNSVFRIAEDTTLIVARNISVHISVEMTKPLNLTVNAEGDAPFPVRLQSVQGNITFVHQSPRVNVEFVSGTLAAVTTDSDIEFFHNQTIDFALDFATTSSVTFQNLTVAEATRITAPRIVVWNLIAPQSLVMKPFTKALITRQVEVRRSSVLEADELDFGADNMSLSYVWRVNHIPLIRSAAVSGASYRAVSMEYDPRYDDRLFVHTYLDEYRRKATSIFEGVIDCHLFHIRFAGEHPEFNGENSVFDVTCTSGVGMFVVGKALTQPLPDPDVNRALHKAIVVFSGIIIGIMFCFIVGPVVYKLARWNRRLEQATEAYSQSLIGD
jgi:hypothetical protein